MYPSRMGGSRARERPLSSPAGDRTKDASSVVRALTPNIDGTPRATAGLLRCCQWNRERDSGLRLAELVAAFSLATDLGLGQPMEHVLRSWVIAARLGDHMGVELDDRGALFYVATPAWVGCVADTPEVAAWFGDDIYASATTRTHPRRDRLP